MTDLEHFEQEIINEVSGNILKKDSSKVCGNQWVKL